MLPTRRQREILDAIRSLAAEHGRSPTLLEIARCCGLGSVSTVHKHLTLLEQRGLIRKRRRGRRSEIEVLRAGRSGTAVQVPLLGRIAAGRPIEAISEERPVSLPKGLVRGHRTYVLQVKGDSMVGEQIHDGDLVVVEERSLPRNGEVVVALIDGREATLKTYRLHRGRIQLIPANPSLQPIEVKPEVLRIQGVAAGLMRRYY